MLSKAGHAPMHDMGRKLMQAHHCSGGDTVVGSANVSSSIFAMLFVGWLVGLAMGAGVALYMRTRQSRNRRAVTDPISPTAPKPVPSWAQNIRHGKTPSAAIRDEAVRTSGAEGPLGVGLVFQRLLKKMRMSRASRKRCSYRGVQAEGLSPEELPAAF